VLIAGRGGTARGGRAIGLGVKNRCAGLAAIAVPCSTPHVGRGLGSFRAQDFALSTVIVATEHRCELLNRGAGEPGGVTMVDGRAATAPSTTLGNDRTGAVERSLPRGNGRGGLADRVVLCKEALCSGRGPDA